MSSSSMYKAQDNKGRVQAQAILGPKPKLSSPSPKSSCPSSQFGSRQRRKTTDIGR